MICKLPIHGEKRVVKLFCLMPRQIDHEIYWLEKIKLEQQYDEGNYAGGSGWKDLRVLV